ncbi:hypothetical protein FQR65_LT15921 [Abscondita terminalis]|nr:hypothetical protein FQR65_LT15921 [Abscondita terminalis]
MNLPCIACSDQCQSICQSKESGPSDSKYKAGSASLSCRNQLLMGVMYEAGKIEHEGLIFTTDKPCVFMLRKQEISLFLMLLIWQTGYAQSGRTVTGTVYDEENRQPLPGVSISLQNAKAGTVTDTQGKFNLTISGNDAVLTFKYIGYESKDVSIPATGAMSVTIRKDNRSLDEVVVIGYGEVQRKDVTGSDGLQVYRLPSESGKPGSGVISRTGSQLTYTIQRTTLLSTDSMERCQCQCIESCGDRTHRKFPEDLQLPPYTEPEELTELY